jgi:hypothetical protein
MYLKKKIEIISDALPCLNVNENIDIYVDYLNKLITHSFTWEIGKEKTKI